MTLYSKPIRLLYDGARRDLDACAVNTVVVGYFSLNAATAGERQSKAALIVSGATLPGTSAWQQLRRLLLMLEPMLDFARLPLIH
jgi:hypothetical protein